MKQIQSPQRCVFLSFTIPGDGQSGQRILLIRLIKRENKNRMSQFSHCFELEKCRKWKDMELRYAEKPQ
jgi:hypothetical protein